MDRSNLRFEVLYCNSLIKFASPVKCSLPLADHPTPPSARVSVGVVPRGGMPYCCVVLEQHGSTHLYNALRQGPTDGGILSENSDAFKVINNEEWHTRLAGLASRTLSHTNTIQFIAIKSNVNACIF